MTPCMRVYWPAQRQEEGRGFVSRRILSTLISRQALIFGNSFVQDFGKVKRILSPWDVFVAAT